MKVFLFGLVLAIAAIGEAAAAPPDGTWVVSLPGDVGWTCNVDWLVRLTIAQGGLTGVHVGDLEGTKSIQTIEKSRLEPKRELRGSDIRDYVGRATWNPLGGFRAVFRRHR